MTIGEIETALTGRDGASRRVSPGQSLHEYAIERFAIGDEHAFSIAVERFLRIGELLYVIAGDGIHANVEAVGHWINARSGTPFHFALLELDSYESATGERLIVPRPRVKTQAIGRHVVEVVVSGSGAGIAQVQIAETIQQVTGRFAKRRASFAPPK